MKGWKNGEKDILRPLLRLNLYVLCIIPVFMLCWVDRQESIDNIIPKMYNFDRIFFFFSEKKIKDEFSLWFVCFWSKHYPTPWTVSIHIIWKRPGGLEKCLNVLNLWVTLNSWCWNTWGERNILDACGVKLNEASTDLHVVDSAASQQIRPAGSPRSLQPPVDGDIELREALRQSWGNGSPLYCSLYSSPHPPPSPPASQSNSHPPSWTSKERKELENKVN